MYILALGHCEKKLNWALLKLSQWLNFFSSVFILLSVKNISKYFVKFLALFLNRHFFVEFFNVRFGEWWGEVLFFLLSFYPTHIFVNFTVKKIERYLIFISGQVNHQKNLSFDRGSIYYTQIVFSPHLIVHSSERVSVFYKDKCIYAAFLFWKAKEASKYFVLMFCDDDVWHDEKGKERDKENRWHGGWWW